MTAAMIFPANPSMTSLHIRLLENRKAGQPLQFGAMKDLKVTAAELWIWSKMRRGIRSARLIDIGRAII
jgi:hypothetical protein